VSSLDLPNGRPDESRAEVRPESLGFGHAELAGGGNESARVPWRPVGLSQTGMAACSARCR
jgi:hypothetical protein